MDKMKGKIKEAAGAVTGDEDLKNEGKVDQAKGSVKQATENVKQGAKEAVGGAADKAKDVAKAAEEQTRRDPDADDT
jgi:uncharacterized protein YjbJ (UPF0337 family)